MSILVPSFRMTEWIKSEDYGPQTFEWFWAYKHRNPLGMADWNRASSQWTGPPLWRLYVILNSLPLLVIPAPVSVLLNCELHAWEYMKACHFLCTLCVVSCVPFHAVILINSVFTTIQTLHVRFLSIFAVRFVIDSILLNTCITMIHSFISCMAAM